MKPALPLTAQLFWPTEDATVAFAQALATQPAIRNAFIALRGNLGAGKTTLVRYLLQALGERRRVKSPSYAVVELYELAQIKVWHCDFFRFTDPREWVDAGLRDVFASPGLKLVEWPEKAGPSLPVADLDILLTPRANGGDDAGRDLALTAHSATGAALFQGVLAAMA